MTINKLPDEDLLEIFEFYMAYPLPPPFLDEDAWHTLVHVCRRWRYVVFGSPRRLDLRLLCINGRLMKTLDIWPELPIVIHVDSWRNGQLPSDSDVISMLKRHDRVCKIFINGVPNTLLEEIATTSFPALIELELASFQGGTPILPDSFLGGSVPSLRSLDLWGIPFPGIGKLLLSTRDLVTLSLGSMSHSGYISPEAMAAILSALTRLKSLHLNFETPEFWAHGASRRPPARTRVVLPSLTEFDFSGTSGYLEDIVSRIDAPLDCIDATFGEPVSDMPLLRDFIGRTKILKAPHRAELFFSSFNDRVSLFQRKGNIDFKVLNILRYTSDPQLSSLTQACSRLLPPLPTLELLGISKYESEFRSSQWLNEVENTQWVELLRPFTAVKDLALDEAFVLSVASALRGLVGEGETETLPALQNIFLEGFQSSDPVPDSITKFTAARGLSGCPVIVHHQNRKQ